MPDKLDFPSILTVAEVARYLRVSETTVWRWCTSGKLPAFRVGRGWRVRRGDLNILISRWVNPEQLEHTSESGNWLAVPTSSEDNQA
jgi:excisionase family DNA binding protein